MAEERVEGSAGCEMNILQAKENEAVFVVPTKPSDEDLAEMSLNPFCRRPSHNSLWRDAWETTRHDVTRTE